MIPTRLPPCFQLKPSKLEATRDSRLQPIRYVLEVGPPRRQDSAGSASDAAGVAPHSEEPRLRQRACGLLRQPDERPEPHLAVQLAHHQCHSGARAQGPRVAARRRPLQLQPRHRPALSDGLCGAEAFVAVLRGGSCGPVAGGNREKKSGRQVGLLLFRAKVFSCTWSFPSLLLCRSNSVTVSCSALLCLLESP